MHEPMPAENLKDFLNAKVDQYCLPHFVETDPVQIPHLFSQKEDIEIAGFLAATIAWGARPMIIKNAKSILARMDNAPYAFVSQAEEGDLRSMLGFKHRTFNDDDLLFFVRALQNLYKYHGGLEGAFTTGYKNVGNIGGAIQHCRACFLETEHLTRSEKHFANVKKKSAAKRLNMFLRWMVRPASAQIDFGLWPEIPTAALMIPLDIHSGNVARRLGLLTRKQDDWRSVEELTGELRQLDANDPVKYDFALFGLGVFEKFWQ